MAEAPAASAITALAASQALLSRNGSPALCRDRKRTAAFEVLCAFMYPVHRLRGGQSGGNRTLPLRGMRAVGTGTSMWCRSRVRGHPGQGRSFKPGAVVPAVAAGRGHRCGAPRFGSGASCAGSGAKCRVPGNAASVQGAASRALGPRWCRASSARPKVPGAGSPEHEAGSGLSTREDRVHEVGSRGVVRGSPGSGARSPTPAESHTSPSALLLGPLQPFCMAVYAGDALRKVAPPLERPTSGSWFVVLSSVCFYALVVLISPVLPLDEPGFGASQ